MIILEIIAYFIGVLFFGLMAYYASVMTYFMIIKFDISSVGDVISLLFGIILFGTFVVLLITITMTFGYHLLVLLGWVVS